MDIQAFVMECWASNVPSAAVVRLLNIVYGMDMMDQKEVESMYKNFDFQYDVVTT